MPTNSHPSLPASSSASRSLDFAGTLLRSILLYSHWGIVSLLAAAVRLDRQDQGGGAPRSEIERLAQALNAGPPLGELAEAPRGSAPWQGPPHPAQGWECRSCR